MWATLVVGGVTRLTHSGLSIVEWQPLVGALPPMSGEEWQAVFARYRQTPEYRLVNAGMSLEEFKGIFWWEYAHRLLGRAVGVAFALPLFVFWRRGGIGRATVVRLLGILLLGGAQGALGWYMVQSGLVDDPRVSPYRLAAHLALAFAIFGALLWTALDFAAPHARGAERDGASNLARIGAWLAALAFVMVVSGAFVAGTRAGLVFNTFPLMAGRVVPAEMFALDPWYMNFFANPAAVQFDHRAGAWLLAVLVPWFTWRVFRAGARPQVRRAAALAVGLLAVQIVLGISTLLLRVPVALGAAHQATAMLLFGVLVWLNHGLRAQAETREASPEMEMAASRGGHFVVRQPIRRRPGSESCGCDG